MTLPSQHVAFKPNRELVSQKVYDDDEDDNNDEDDDDDEDEEDERDDDEAVEVYDGTEELTL